MLIALTCASSYVALERLAWTKRADNVYLDAWHRLAGKRFEPRHTALILVDDASLARHADTPLVFWTPLFAKAIGTLRQVGARVVVLDFILSGSPELWLARLGLRTSETSTYDLPFRQALHQGRVVLAAYLVAENAADEDFILPSPDYLLSLPDQDVAGHVGLANLSMDADSVVRQIPVPSSRVGRSHEAGLPELPLAVLAAQQAGLVEPPKWPRRIVYAGPPGSFPSHSFSTLLEPDAANRAEVQSLKNKVVIIGAGYAGMNDVHPTPFSNTFGAADRMMSGAEIQANVVETLLGGHTAKNLPVIYAALGAFVIAWVNAFVLLRWGLVWGGASFLGACVLMAWLGFRAFLMDIDVSVAQLQLTTFVALPMAGLSKFSRIEREKRHLATVFSRYISPAIMQTLLAQPDLPALGGCRREITVLFSDIRNFTTLSERLQPEEVVELLNEYFERACAVLLTEEATIDKFIGDAIMAEFGAPLEQSDHATRAIRAALSLLATASEFSAWVKQRFPKHDLPSFSIGIGIHTGPAVIGNIGSRRRMEYTAVGDTVNTASRLEGMTKTVGCPILASAATVAAVTEPRLFHFGRHHMLTVKGKQGLIEAVEIWPVTTVR